MNTYYYTIYERYEKEVPVEAESKEEARDILSDMLSKNDPEVRMVYFPEGNPEVWWDLDKVVEDDSEKEYDVDELKDDPGTAEVMEVTALSPDNVKGMLEAVGESYRKLYTEGK